MKVLFPLLFLLPAMSIAQMNENFEEADLGAWTESSLGHWEISTNSALSGSYSLHHSYDNPESGHDQISIPLWGLAPQKGETSWRFLIKHGYSSSSNNNWAVYLLSDTDAKGMFPGTGAEAIVIGVNFRGYDDTLKVWKCSGKDATVIFNSHLNWQNSGVDTGPAGIEVRRSAEGVWRVYYFPGTEWQGREDLGSFSNTDLTSFPYFGIYYEYSKAQDMKLWFDELSIEGVFMEDTIGPGVRSAAFTSVSSVGLLFNEAVAGPLPGDNENFLMNNDMGQPLFVRPQGAQGIEISFAESFTSGTDYQLELGGVKDMYGNSMKDTLISLHYYLPGPYDIVINEIMADPSPPVGLAVEEYLELFNTSAYRLDLEGWSLGVGDKRSFLTDMIMEPGAFLVLDEGLIPALNNDGAVLCLRDSTGQVISHVNYEGDWYGSDSKDDGGWSLEQINPYAPCLGAENWRASLAYPGGTPGSINSVFAEQSDLIAPVISSLVVEGDSALLLEFSESYDRESALDPGNYIVDQGVGKAWEARALEPEFRKLWLSFGKEFRRGVIYSLDIVGDIRDCAGNLLDHSASLQFGIAEQADSLSVVINEILYDPLPGGVDFIELFNTSDMPIDLSGLGLLRRDPLSGETADFYRLSEEDMSLLPGAYMVCCEEASTLLQYYPQARNICTMNLPALPNGEGEIILANISLDRIDAMAWKDDMHFPLLESTEGVSLEKINPALPGMDRSGWHSAAGTEGYATPGYRNSQYIDDPGAAGPVKLEPEVFSPDNDGHDDIVWLSYSFNEPGNVADIIVFDASGRRVRTLAESVLLSADGSFSWDGRNDSGERAGRGIYVFYIRIFDLDGRVKGYKKSTVLSIRF